MGVFAALHKPGLSIADAARVLAQCRQQIQNRATIEDMAREAELQLSGFRTSEELELYYDIGQKGRNMGFVSKGWDEPGFRIGEVLSLPTEAVDAFCKRAPKLMDFFSTNGVTCTWRFMPDGLELSLMDNIYSEGLNLATLLHSLEAVNQCVCRVKSLLNLG